MFNILSRDKWNNLRVARIVNDPTLWVPESQFQDYASRHDVDISVVPDIVTSNLSDWSNYVLNASGGNRHVLIHDSLNLVGYWEGGKREVLDADSLERMVVHGFEIAEQMGVRLWGINLGRDATRYRTQAPFSLLAPVIGPFTCHFKPELRFDSTMGAVFQADFWLRNIQQYHRTLRFNKYHFTTPPSIEPGEVESAQRLQARWGEVVEIAKKGKKLDLKFKIPIEGI